VKQSGKYAAVLYYQAGMSYLKAGRRDRALASVKEIQALQSELHLIVPNASLADKLMARTDSLGDQ